MENKAMKAINLVKFVPQFALRKEFLDRSDWVKYKTIPDWHNKIVEDIINVNMEKEFISFVEKHVNAYIFEKQAPPKEIATAIMNIADDFLDSRDFSIRSGDYISLMNNFRSNK